MQKFKFQRRSCKLSLLFQPRRQSARESLRTRRLLNLKTIYFVQDTKPFSRLEIPAKTPDFSAALSITEINFEYIPPFFLKESGRNEIHQEHESCLPIKYFVFIRICFPLDWEMTSLRRLTKKLFLVPILAFALYVGIVLYYLFSSTEHLTRPKKAGGLFNNAVSVRTLNISTTHAPLKEILDRSYDQTDPGLKQSQPEVTLKEECQENSFLLGKFYQVFYHVRLRFKISA